jgi:hypothetical protein
MVPVAFRHPELVIVAGRPVVGRLVELAGVFRVQRELDLVLEDRIAALVGALRNQYLQLLELGVGDERLVFPLRRPRHRRHAVVGPDALQVRVPIGRSRNLVRGIRAVLRAGLQLRRLCEDRHRGQSCCCEKGSKRSHGYLPASKAATPAVRRSFPDAVMFVQPEV